MKALRALAPAIAGVSLACSAEPVRQDAHPNTPSALVSERARLRAPAAASTAATPPDALLPLIAEPRFEPVARALESGDERAAARAADAVLGRDFKVVDVDSARAALFSARLMETAGDLARAAQLYGMAASLEWLLAPDAALGAARSELQLGRAEDSLERLRRVPTESPVASGADECRGRALLSTGAREEAVVALRRAARAASPSTAERSQLLLATTLLDGTSPGGPASSTDVAEALGLARRACVAFAARPELLATARAVEARALAALPEAERRPLARPDFDDTRAFVAALVDSRQYEAALLAADSFFSGAPKERFSPVGCEMSLLTARALGGTRAWAKASELAETASKHCTDPDARARALFLAGKYSESEKRYAEAIRFYEAVQKEYPTHRLSDDARYREALDYSELGSEARFTELVLRMPEDYPSGDTVLDALFELAVRRFGKGDWSGAALVLDRAVAAPAAAGAPRGPELAARERYFRARASAEEGDTERSLAEYEAIVAEAPLSYYMLQAYTRLAARDPARADRALASALARAKDLKFEVPERPPSSDASLARVLELLRVSDVPRALEEQTALSASGPLPAEVSWMLARILARADAAAAEKLVLSLPRDWLAAWPSGDFRRAWEAAYPRPYHDLVRRSADRNGVTESLVYAVMREESQFDPRAESPAQAFGLMQLIVPTARQFGRALGLSPDASELRKPAVNVAIGCRVLGDLQARFPDNPLLAIPGYNAGPAASRRWVTARPDADFDVWVELIPYTETRRYAKRVLASRAAYAFLYDGERAETALRLPLRISGK